MNEAIPMRLNCPECGMLHVDQGEFATRIHHTHSCQSCGLTWRPCVLPTVGVQHLPGFKDDDPTPGLHDVRVVSAARLRELEQISLQYGEALAKKMLADDRSEKAERNLATILNYLVPQALIGEAFSATAARIIKERDELKARLGDCQWPKCDEGRPEWRCARLEAENKALKRQLNDTREQADNNESDLGTINEMLGLPPEAIVDRTIEALASIQGAASAATAHDPGHPHLINGEFQSDKYPTCPRGKVPLSVKDKTAQDLLWTYAQRRRSVDAEFAADLELALSKAGYRPTPPEAAGSDAVAVYRAQDERDAAHAEVERLKDAAAAERGGLTPEQIARGLPLVQAIAAWRGANSRPAWSYESADDRALIKAIDDFMLGPLVSAVPRGEGGK